jgi:hypothetical protein
MDSRCSLFDCSGHECPWILSCEKPSQVDDRWLRYSSRTLLILRDQYPVSPGGYSIFFQQAKRLVDIPPRENGSDPRGILRGVVAISQNRNNQLLERELNPVTKKNHKDFSNCSLRDTVGMPNTKSITGTCDHIKWLGAKCMASICTEKVVWHFSPAVVTVHFLYNHTTY